MPNDLPWLQPYQERLRFAAGIAGLLFTGVVVVAAFAFFASFIWPSGVAPDTRVYAGHVDDFAVDSPVLFEEEQFYLVRRPDDTFIALYVINPHNLPDECPIEWITEISRYGWAHQAGSLGAFRAPCHGETFSITGERLFGPSPRDLDRFPVVVDGDRVYVEAGKQDLVKVPSTP